MHEVRQLMGIHKFRTTPYHPQCDGLVEHQYYPLLSHNTRTAGVIGLVLAVYAYNTSCHESTGFSPCELVFGKDLRTPLALDLDLPLKTPVVILTIAAQSVVLCMTLK